MYQTVNNLGGNSNLKSGALGWIQRRARNSVFRRNGTSEAAETRCRRLRWVGRLPRFYGDQNARLFIYWTADNYKSTGCYNLDCAAFVQTNSDITLGGDFGSNYSTLGGTQYDFSAQFRFYNGNWWLAIQGAWVGYYPGTIYKGGQLSKYAQQIQFGTESLGSTVWPAEGSGEWSTSGWAKSAYQRNLFHVNTSGTAVWNTLTQWNSSPECYSVSGPFSNTVLAGTCSSTKADRAAGANKQTGNRGNGREGNGLPDPLSPHRTGQADFAHPASS